MISFWGSIDRLAMESLKVAWFGILVTFLGLLFPDYRWVSWFGLSATVVGMCLRHRAEWLKRSAAAPRRLTLEQRQMLIQQLSEVAKEPVVVGFFGVDAEAKSFATEIRTLLEAAKFSVEKLEAFAVFEIRYSLGITVFGGDDSPTAIGLRTAFANIGLEVRLQTNPNRMMPRIHLDVYSKPPR